MIEAIVIIIAASCVLYCAVYGARRGDTYKWVQS